MQGFDGRIVTVEGTVKEASQKVSALQGQVNGVKNDVGTVKKNFADLKSEVNKGITFAGNEGVQNRKLGNSFTIRGNATTVGSYSSGNVKTVVTEKGLEIQLADAPVFTGKVSSQGFNDGNKRIENVAAGTASTDGVNKGQLDRVHSLVTGDVKLASLSVNGKNFNSVQDAFSSFKFNSDGSATAIPQFDGDAKGKVIRNMSPGKVAAGSTDGVTGGQFYSATQELKG